MSNIVRTDIDAVNVVLTITLPKEEYLSKVQQDIKKYAQRSAMKGFRPGKTPQTLVKKIYGNAFLMDAVNDKIQEHIANYLEAEKINMFGQPIPSEDQPKNDFDLKNPQDLVFKFDIGLMPEFEIQGLDGANMSIYAIEIDEALVTKEIENLQTRLGGEIEVEDTILEKDTITLHIKEQGGSIDKDLVVGVEWLTDDMKSVFLTQKKGDQLQINIFQLEKETTPQFVRKQFLGLDENDDREVNEIFNAEITKVTRREVAKLNEDFFKKGFGENVTTEEEARDLIRKSLKSNYQAQAEALLLRDLQDKILNENPLVLPESFLKRWLKSQNKQNTDDIIDKGYKGFAENMRWTLIRNKLMLDAGETVTNEDIKENYRNRIRGYFGGMAADENIVEMLVDRAMKEEKQVNELYEDAITEKVFNIMKSKITMIEKPISQDDFNSMISAAQFETAKARGEISEVSAEEVAVEEVTADA
jgi:trigger factor